MADEYSNVTDILSYPPPKDVTVEQDMTGNSVTLTVRHTSLFKRFEWILVTAIWVGFFGYWVYEGELPVKVFLVFISPVVIFVVNIFLAFFGKHVIHLDRGQGTVFVGVGKLGWKWKFTYTRNSFIEIRCGKNTSRIVVAARQGKRLASARSLRDCWNTYREHRNNKDFCFGSFFDSGDVMEYITAFLIREARQQS